MSIEKAYYKVHQAFSKPEERGEYSSGYWQDLIRKNALDMCRIGDGKVLEVGCGEGLFLSQLLQTYPSLELSGVDGWSEILSKAQRRLQLLRPGVELKQADAADLPFDDNCFDRVVCVNVFFNMESIDKVRSAINEIARVCKKGGKIIFDIRNSQNPLLFLKYRYAKYYDATVENLPLNTYNLGEIREILNDAGFAVAQERPMFTQFKILSPIVMFEAVKKLC